MKIKLLVSCVTDASLKSSELLQMRDNFLFSADKRLKLLMVSICHYSFSIILKKKRSLLLPFSHIVLKT
jgi:hypothetical protein